VTPEQLLATYGPRESMEYDVVVVGAGPGGLAAAIRLKQLAVEGGREVSVCVLEKGSEPGALAISFFPPLFLSLYFRSHFDSVVSPPLRTPPFPSPDGTTV